ncbi:MAG: DUF5702 domain-containing protein, partial [Clostridia bacterium]|nr:DUF5702 domain-containing protein [Clostridia bacterium]
LNKKGAVTVFTGVIMPVVIGACVLMSDLCLYDSGNRIIKRSVDACAYSILGNYSGYLMDDYEIYAYAMGENRAKSLAFENLKNNLGNSSIYDFRIERLEISRNKPLIDPSVMAKAVLRAATDDFYASLADEFMERFDMLSGMAGAAEIINMKMRLDEAYKKLKEGMSAVNKLINGDGDLEYYVNMAGFDAGFFDAVNQFKGYIEELSQIEAEIVKIREMLEEEPDEKAGIGILLEEKRGMLREQAAEVYGCFIEGFVRGLREANEKAIGRIEEIFVERTNIHLISDAIRRKISDAEDCPVYLKEILTACTDLVSDVEETLVEQVFEEIKLKLDENISMLAQIEEAFILTVENGDGSVDLEIDVFSEGYDFSVDFRIPDEINAGKGEDRRGFFEELGKRILQKQLGEDKCIPEGTVLPSSIYSVDTAAFSATSLSNDTKSGEDEIGRIGMTVKTADVRLPDNLLINEYILRHFLFENSRTDIGRIGKFFNNETEYILWGADSQNANVFFTKSALMSTRFALDAIHVYTDSEKIAKADALAAATAGWWTMGAGIPVMSNLIKISWAIAEAGIDTRKLWNGEDITLIKTPGDWITDIGINKAAPSPGLLKMKYDDYLRLYLLAVPIEKKAARMLDIISLNAPAYFDIFAAYTEITVTALVSFNSLTGERHEVEVSTTVSY